MSVTESGRQLRRPLHTEGGDEKVAVADCRKRAAVKAAVTGHLRPVLCGTEKGRIGPKLKCWRLRNARETRIINT
jgi:hypothetical protein